MKGIVFLRVNGALLDVNSRTVTPVILKRGNSANYLHPPLHSNLPISIFGKGFPILYATFNSKGGME